MTCKYPNCKYKGKPDYCGKHFKTVDKMNNPSKYCSKIKCVQLRKEGYKRCQKCIDNGKRTDLKRKNKERIEGKCRRCGKNIENFKTRSGKKSTLCQYHYGLQSKTETKRPERDRKEEYKEYDKLRKDNEERKQWKSDYARSINGKLSHYKSKAKTEDKRKWDLTDEQAISLFKSKCHYCPRIPSEGDWNGIDRVINELHYFWMNVVPCCIICNNMKKNLSYHNFINQCKKISENFS